ncbi:MAG: sulfurtransferase [Burkholderiaceae bacterium]
MQFTTLISAAELQQHINNPTFVILDCRAELTDPNAGAVAFAAGHIPGAQHADSDRDLSDKSPGPNGEFRGRHPLPTVDHFIETLRGWGVYPNSQVIAYDAHGGMFATRVWWMLRWVGHKSVAVLDGGLPAWEALGGELTQAVINRPRGSITPQASLVSSVSADDVLANLSARARVVLDARAADRFRGENETIDPVAGRIPGARNRWFKDNLQADGKFKSPDLLRAEYSALIKSPESTIMQCGSGISACHNLLAMDIAGLPGAMLYPGSWSEWSADPSRPVAVGD